MASPRVDILMYHSISDHQGPTNIPANMFAMQMNCLAESEIAVVGLDDLVAHRDHGQALPPRSVVITFDDGFVDFAQTAWPILKSHGFSAINYLPSRYLGGFDEWEGDQDPRPIMDIELVKSLRNEGAEFGSHTVSHPKLPTCSQQELVAELAGSKEYLANLFDQDIRHFAPPYGATNEAVRSEIEKHYETSVGVELSSAHNLNDLHMLPRIEMFYFQNQRRWNAFLSGRGEGYLSLRRGLRKLRALI